MLAGLRVVWRGLNDMRLKGYVYIWANFAFVALCLPVITAPAAFVALMRLGHAAQTEPWEADLSLFWDTFRAYLWRALPWGLLMALFMLVNFSNLWSYSQSSDSLVAVLQIIWSGASFIGLALLMYTWPMYFEMETPTILGATRNAGVMLIRHPFLTLVIVLVWLLLALISTVMLVPWLLLTWGAFTALANAAVQDRLHAYREAQAQAASGRAGTA